MKTTIIDNILHENDFNNISNVIVENEDFLWKYVPNIEGVKFKENSTKNLFYMVHNLYSILSRVDAAGKIMTNITEEQEPIIDHYYEVLKPLTFNLSKLGLKWWRIKCNLYPATETLQEHEFHTDNPVPHIAGIFSLNTCDGYTKFEDGTKIDSVANRMLVFEGETLHTSSSTTDQVVRCNINFNYV